MKLNMKKATKLIIPKIWCNWNVDLEPKQKSLQ